MDFSNHLTSIIFLCNIFIFLLEGMELHPVTSNEVVGDDKWIEALVVADQSVVNFHGKSKVEKYLLILSNMVTLLLLLFLSNYSSQ